MSGLVGGSLLAALYLGLPFGSLQRIGELVDHPAGLMKDFYDYFYRTGRSLGEGFGPVGGFLYPPLFGILMMPFAWLSPRDAQFLWGASRRFPPSGWRRFPRGLRHPGSFGRLSR